MQQWAGRAARSILEAQGYWFRQREALPYGVDYLLDVRRLSAAWRLPIRTFFDVGANEGQTVRAARAAFSQAKIYAFEPHTPTFAKLELAETGELLVSFNCAVGDKNDVVPMFVHGSLLNSLHPDARYNVRFSVPLQETISVPCVTLDRFCADHGVISIDVLKVDTEGHELAVLRGATGLLSSGAVRFVYTEFNDFAGRPGISGGALAPIGELLSPLGFRMISTYTDHIVTDGELFVTSNALFALPPDSGGA
jgi:FkbM family methyltransferase